MDLSIPETLAALHALAVGQLRERYAEIFGAAAPTSHRGWLLRRIAWRLQALAEGDLSERARVRAAGLANEADLRVSPPRQSEAATTASSPQAPARNSPVVKPGTILTRRYRGQTLQVRVLLKGFEFQGRVYPSLTAVAQAATGSHWSGHRFFGLKEPQ